jgi:hypothetical protein
MTEFIHADTTGSGRRHVEINRLLLGANLDVELKLEEYYDESLATRVISMPSGSEQADYHGQLQDKQLPVFPALERHDQLLLAVPQGTRSLTKLLRFVARDIPNYSQVFYVFGAALSQMDDANVGLPTRQSERALLDNFAFALDEADAYGGKIYLTPPYQLDPTMTIERELSDLHGELSNTGLFHDSEVIHLLDKTKEGWHYGPRPQ